MSDIRLTGRSAVIDITMSHKHADPSEAYPQGTRAVLQAWASQYIASTIDKREWRKLVEQETWNTQLLDNRMAIFVRDRMPTTIRR